MFNQLETEKIFLLFVEEALELTSGILSKNTDSNLGEIEEWDSLSIMSFTSLIDQEFEVEIDTDVLLDCKTPSELYMLINKLVK